MKIIDGLVLTSMDTIDGYIEIGRLFWANTKQKYKMILVAGGETRYEDTSMFWIPFTSNFVVRLYDKRLKKGDIEVIDCRVNQYIPVYYDKIFTKFLKKLYRKINDHLEMYDR